MKSRIYSSFEQVCDRYGFFEQFLTINTVVLVVSPYLNGPDFRSHIFDFIIQCIIGAFYFFVLLSTQKLRFKRSLPDAVVLNLSRLLPNFNQFAKQQFVMLNPLVLYILEVLVIIDMLSPSTLVIYERLGTEQMVVVNNGVDEIAILCRSHIELSTVAHINFIDYYMRSQKVIESEEQQEEQQDFDSKQQLLIKYTPRFRKHVLEGVNLNKIIINISQTQYPVLETVACLLDWKIQIAASETWDVFWTDHAIEPEQLFRMQEHQKINHFPGMYTLARKNLLGKGLMRMRKEFPEEYNFFPLTWMIPGEFNEFSIYFNLCKSQGKKETYIAKPEASSQGKGIFLTRSLQDFEGQQNYVVQKYIDKPYLINSLKFDFRIYVLLAGCDPMRIYIYNEGLVRFATQSYKNPKKKNLKQACMHLTNYAINKDNPNFVFNKSEKKMDVGHKRSLTSVYALLEASGVNVTRIKEKINDGVVKTLITGQPLISHLYQLSQPENYSNDMCFQILGFDILIDENHEPLLLEVNHTPSFTTDTPLDRHIKKNLIKDTLILMNINLQTKINKYTHRKEIIELRTQRKRVKLTGLEKYLLRKENQTKRDQYEDCHLGNFSKIYPTDNEQSMHKYEKLLKTAEKVFEEQSGIKRRLRRQNQDRFREENSPSKKQMRKTLLLKHKDSANSGKETPTLPSIQLPQKLSRDIIKHKNIFSEQYSVKQLPKVNLEYLKLAHSNFVNLNLEALEARSPLKLECKPATVRVTKKDQEKFSQLNFRKPSSGQFLTPKTFSIKEENKQTMIKKLPVNFEVYIKRQLEGRGREPIEVTSKKQWSSGKM